MIASECIKNEKQRSLISFPCPLGIHNISLLSLIIVLMEEMAAKQDSLLCENFQFRLELEYFLKDRENTSGGN